MKQPIAHSQSKQQHHMGKNPGAGVSDQMHQKREDKTPAAPPRSDFEELRHDALGAQDRRSNLTSDAAVRNYPKLR